MPKELTHWMLASRARDGLLDGPVRSAVAARPNLYLLGAVILDSPLYAIHESDMFNKISLRLHGTHGEDTFRPLERLLSLYPDPLPADLLAFFSGIMSHVMADCAYHPWVVYFSGPCNEVPPDLAHKSLSRHRLLETWLDIHTFDSRPELAGKLYAKVLARAETSRNRLMDMLSMLYFDGKSGHENQIRLALASHGLLQWAFLQKPFFIGFGRINRLAQNRWDPYATLFYPRTRPGAGGLFPRPLTYKNPVTGTKKEEPLAQVEKKALASTAKFFQSMEKRLKNNTFREWFAGLHGPSLETGMKGVPGSAAVHVDMDADLNALIGIIDAPGAPSPCPRRRHQQGPRTRIDH